jgi:RHS repeat-associated protein
VYADDGSGWTYNGLSKSGGIPYFSDTNGNSIISGIDTLGRTISTNGSYYDSTGAAHGISVTTEVVNISTSLCGPPGQLPGLCSEYTGTWTVPHIITLPDGLTYTINYVQNDEGEISSITLPTGALISYTYVQPPAGDYGGQRVHTRTVNANGQVSTWTYTYTELSGSNRTTTLIDPDQNQTVYTCANNTRSIYVGASTPVNWLDPPCYVSNEQYSNSSGTLVKTVNRALTNSNPAAISYWPGLPAAVTTTWNQTNQVSLVEMDYETMTATMFPDGTQGPATAPITWGNIKEKREYDYGTGTPGALLKKTDYSYLHTDTTVNPNANIALYLAANIADRPTSEIVYDGSGNLLSKTFYYYDQGSLISTSGNPAVDHDYTNFSSTNLIRGNLTQVSRWDTSTSSWLNTTYTYDDLGNRRTMTDPGGHTTTYDYTDQFSGKSCNTTGSPTYAFPTTVTDVNGFQTKSSYFQCTCQLQSVKDQNDIDNSRTGTTHTYDLMNRPSTTGYPDGGSVTLSYGGNSTNGYQDPLPLTVTKTVAVDSTKSYVPSVSITDGLGRVIQTQALNPEGTIYVDTTYDLLSRVYSVSNPHFSTASPTDGITYHSYDLFNRPLTVTHPDSSVLTYEYDGTAAMTTDEGNGNGTQKVQRVLDYDGLKRLKSVCEVSGNTQKGSTGNTPVACGQAKPMTGFLTTYNYGFDSTTHYSTITALQAGLANRSFEYDSLGRLQSAYNPEAGTTSYTYNADSLLYTRTRPQANQTGSYTTTKTYAYAVHNLTSETYNDGVTPANYYNYFESSLWGRTLQNRKYHRTSSMVGVNSLSGSGLISGETYSYDPMGRLWANDQCTPGLCATTHNTFDYSYDYIGNELTATDGESHTYTRTTDAAGRLLTATSSISDANHPANLMSNAVYGPFGIGSLEIGGTMIETTLYQNRGWTKSISDAVVATNQTFYATTPGHAPNGDVTSSTDTYNGNWSYTYDEFNRLTVASDATNSLGWAYDRFGNRWQQNVLAGSGLTVLNTFSGSNNRVDANSYDAAGNIMNDGYNKYTYDAEGRVTCVVSVGGTCTSTAGTHYAYDADGLRVAKLNGTTVTYQYLYNAKSQMVTELNGSGNWFRGEIYAGGTYLGTYYNGGTTFGMGDWLGNIRYRANPNGSVAETCTNMPFGDSLTCSGSETSPKHFTGQFRDPESGLDYFGARFYSSIQGRFLTPDWSATPQAVPYGHFENPQSLNLYGYVHNSPITDVDADGHDFLDAFKHLAAALAQTAVKVSAGIGAEVKGNVGPVELKGGAAALVNLQHDKGTLSVSTSVDIGLSVSLGNSKAGADASAEKVIGSLNLDTGETKGAGPVVGDKVLGVENVSGNSDKVVIGGGLEGAGPVGGGKASTTQEGLQEFKAAGNEFVNSVLNLISPVPAPPQAPPKPGIQVPTQPSNATGNEGQIN